MPKRGQFAVEPLRDKVKKTFVDSLNWSNSSQITPDVNSRLAPSTEERQRQAGLILEVTLSLGEGVAAVTFLALGRIRALTRSQSPLRGQFWAGGESCKTNGS